MYENWIWVGDSEPPATTEQGEHWIGPDRLKSCDFFEQVNDETELMPGTASAAELAFALWNAPDMPEGTRLAYFQKQGESLVRIGTFKAEKPTQDTRSTHKVIAYDAVARTEKDLSPWLRSIQGQFPMTLLAFARAVCAQCGVPLVNTELPNGSYQIQQFYSDGMTGRQLLVWVGQACGRFLRATPEGRLEFAWYRQTAMPITCERTVMAKVRLAGDTLRVQDRDPAAPPQGPEIYRIGIGAQWYYADGLSFEDYETAAVDKVQINQSESDVGVIVPPEQTGTNALVISGNLLLTTDSDAALRPVAETLYEQFRDIRYTPFKVTLPADSGFRAGDIVTVADANGKSFLSYVMSAKTSGGRVTLESTGSARRDASTAVNRSVQRNLRGKMLEIETSVDGLRVTASELSGNYAELSLTVDGISTTVEANKKEVDEQLGEVETNLRSEITQTAESITSTVEENVNKKLGDYSTTEQMNSVIEQTAKSITSTVEKTYATKTENKETLETARSEIKQTATDITSTVELNVTEKLGDYSTTKQMRSEIKQAAESISLSVSNGETGSSFTLTAGETKLSSGNITFSGLVNFVSKGDLSAAGRTTINGGNITTGSINANLITTGELSASLIKSGTIQSSTGTTIYDLTNGTIQMGSTAEANVKITNNMIRWYLGTSHYANGGPTGIFYSVDGNTWIGANSTHVYMGWVTGGTPSGGDSNRTNGYHGVRITQDTGGAGLAHFNTAKVECGGDWNSGGGQFEAYRFVANGTVLTRTGAQVMAVSSKGYGDITLSSTGSASPVAFDNGSGVLDETGKCWLFLTDEFAATVSTNVIPQWHITPTCETATPMTVQKDGLTAVVTGEPGATFDWLCILPQKGCETLYCEPVEADLSDGMDRKDYTAESELDGIEDFERNLNDEVLTAVRENTFIEKTWPEEVERSA